MESPGKSRIARLAFLASVLLLIGALATSIAAADTPEGTPPTPEETVETPVEVVKPPPEEHADTPPPPPEEGPKSEPPPAKEGSESVVPPAKEVEAVVHPLPEAVGVKPQPGGDEAKAGDEAPSGGAAAAPSADGVAAATAEGKTGTGPVVTHHHASHTHGASGAHHSSAPPKSSGAVHGDSSAGAPSTDRGPGTTSSPSAGTIARPESLRFLSQWVGAGALSSQAKHPRGHDHAPAQVAPPKTGLDSAQAVESSPGGIGSFFSAITAPVRHAFSHGGARLPMIFFYAALMIGLVALVIGATQGIGALDGLSHRWRRFRSE